MGPVEDVQLDTVMMPAQNMKAEKRGENLRKYKTEPCMQRAHGKFRTLFKSALPDQRQPIPKMLFWGVLRSHSAFTTPAEWILSIFFTVRTAEIVVPTVPGRLIARELAALRVPSS